MYHPPPVFIKQKLPSRPSSEKQQQLVIATALITEQCWSSWSCVEFCDALLLLCCHGDRFTADFILLLPWIRVMERRARSARCSGGQSVRSTDWWTDVQSATWLRRHGGAAPVIECSKQHKPALRSPLAKAKAWNANFLFTDVFHYTQAIKSPQSRTNWDHILTQTAFYRPLFYFRLLSVWWKL